MSDPEQPAGNARAYAELSRKLYVELERTRLELSRARQPVAIIGLACRFPGGEDLAGFRALLAEGRSGVTATAAERWPDHPVSHFPACKWGAFIESIDLFDAEFFGIAPTEARLLDPQQRLLLETSWHALEDAGIDPAGLKNTDTGVYAGISSSDYRDIVAANAAASSLHATTGNYASTAAGRVAFALGLEGPAVAVDTACSSSLVAIHHAVVALQRSEANLALAGGVNAILSPVLSEAFAGGGMLAPDGCCKTFDAAADGYVRGEGCAMLILKRLSEAEADGDRILGVVLGSAVNQDGASAGLTAPNGPSQERVIREALARAGIDSAEVDYLEAHGTGTELGDPIEVQAAAACYGEGRPPDRPLLIGSVKTNLGHLEAAAGVAGLVKALVAMEQGRIPRHRNFVSPNPRIDWEQLPVRVTAEATPWPATEGRPPYAAVSSFGFSGTNAHLILKGRAADLTGEIRGLPVPACPDMPAEPASTARRTRLLPLSGRSVSAVRALAGRYLAWIDDLRAFPEEEEHLADASWTAATGRRHLGHRAVVAFSDLPDLRSGLERLRRDAPVKNAVTRSRTGFLFTGQGSVWPGMGRELYATEPEVRKSLDRCEVAFREERGCSLLDPMFGRTSVDLTATEWAQPALYALQCALVSLWSQLGVRPDAVLGHSVGELAAAYAAGIWTLEDGLRFATRRGALMGRLPAGGAMVAAFAPEGRIQEAIAANSELSLAADNGTHQVVSGPAAALERFTSSLADEGIAIRPLATSHGFHSALMDLVLKAVADLADPDMLSMPSTVFVSSVTGHALNEAPGRDYWRRQARDPVRFAAGIRTLAERGVDLVVEIGPRPVLAPLAAELWPVEEPDRAVFIASLEDSPSQSGLAPAAGRAWQAGAPVALAGLFAGEARRRVRLPTYPFQRRRHWVETAPQPGRGDHPLLGTRTELAAGGTAYEMVLTAKEPQWLADHIVFGRIVVPGALWGALAAAVALRASPDSVAVEGMQLFAPLALEGSDDVRIVQTATGPVGKDGRLELSIHSRRQDSEDWRLHAEATVSAGAEDESPSLTLDDLHPAPADYRSMAKAGIELGPAFQVVEEFRSGTAQGMASVVRPHGLSDAGMAIHPTLLDGCFQAVVAAVGESDAPYVPFGWDRLWLRESLPEQIECAARLRDIPGETLTADLELRAVDGSRIGTITGLTARRATRDAMLSAIRDENDLIYEVLWRTPDEVAEGQPAAFLSSPPEVAARTAGIQDYLVAENVAPGRQATFAGELEDLSRSFARSALLKLGWQPGTEDGTFLSGLPLTQAQEQLAVRLLALAREDIARRAEPEDPLGMAGRLAAACPFGQAEIGLLQRCGKALAEVLLGRAQPLDLLFGDDESGAASLYREAPAARTANRLLADAVATMVSELPEGRTLRILEVGGGTGATTDMVLGVLPSGRFSYHFTDVSAAFLQPARRRFAAHPLTFGVLDIERNPTEQGFAAQGYDLVIAAQVLHATRDLTESLEHCRLLLAPSGCLALLEGLRQQAWLDLTFGLLDGWWRFADIWRTDGALVGETVWKQALAGSGFDEVEVLPTGFDDWNRAVQGVVLARAPEAISEPSGLWVVAAERSEVARRLALTLVSRNQRVVLASADTSLEDHEPAVLPACVNVTRREAWRSLFEYLPGEVPFRGVVCFASPEGDDTNAAGSAAASLDLLAMALALTQGLDDAGVVPEAGLWFATLNGQVVEDELASGLWGAGWWGFARTVALEAPQLNVRLVDLENDDMDREVRLTGELLHPDRETAVAWRGGRRRVARLARGISAARSTAWTGQLRPDGAWLVTGGLGDLGLLTADWLAERGVGTIVLNGRRAPGEAAVARIEALRLLGVDLRVELADATSAEDLNRILASIDAGPHPLSGIIHCAGVLADGAFPNLDRERFEQVLRPKVFPAWHLHEATRDRELELFVMFSSAVGTLGNPGQSSHGAANAYLDQLAAHRRALGLPAQSIAWGAWSDIGAAAGQRSRVRDRLGAAGIGWITPGQGMRLFDSLVEMNPPCCVAAAMDWPSAARAHPGPIPPFLEEVMPTIEAPPEETTVGASDLLSRLEGIEPGEKQRLLVAFIQGEVQAVLQLPELPAPTVGFFDLGMDSLMAVEFRSRLKHAFRGSWAVPGTIVFDYPNATALARHAAEQLAGDNRKSVRRLTVRRRSEDDRIAVIGVACRFPGAESVDAFWERLDVGADLITEAPADRPFQAEWQGMLPKMGGFVRDLDQFDAAFFNIAPAEAELLDPQQRMLLETSWHALEDAGIDPGSLQESHTGVFVGISTADYRELAAAGEAADSFYVTTGTSASTAIGRVAYTLGLQGPVMALDTACSSSLVAVHQAAQALRQGDTGLVLVGGVNAILTSITTRSFFGGGILSPDGSCKTFDAAANGYVRGEGCGMLVLKRLTEAERDGDRIRAVILGSSVNHDGASAGLTTPNGPAQERVISEALERAGIEPAEVDYLEAHGTGTELGDPIEVRAAAAVYGEGRQPGQPLLIGSVKTNFGHLEAAAGAAGLIKVLLAMEHGRIPQHLHFRTPSPHIEWDSLPVRVTGEATPWPEADGKPPRASVSSFGFSGTNAHVILEGRPTMSDRAEPAKIGPDAQPGRRRLLPLSSRSAEALRMLAQSWLTWLEKPERAARQDDPEFLADLAWTAATGRRHFACRATLPCGDGAELQSGLTELVNGPLVPDAGERQRVAFLITGQGSQWPGMGQALYENAPTARDVFDRCEAAFREVQGESLLDAMFGRTEVDLAETAWTQPSLYALACALAAQWAELGMQPMAVLGHSVGELAAAHIAGMISLTDGLEFAARRGALMGSLPAGGAMAAVFATEDRIASTLSGLPTLSIAADNGSHVVVSGPTTEVDTLAAALGTSGIGIRPLATSCAFHSALMDPILDELAELGDRPATNMPSVPMVSNLTGRVLTTPPDGAYWRRHARERVAFAGGVRTLAEMGADLVIELGPRPVLGPLAERLWPRGKGTDPAFIASLGGPSGKGLTAAAGLAWARGADIALAGLFEGESRRRIAIPNTPFERQRYWTESAPRQRVGIDHPFLGIRSDSATGETTFERAISTSDPAWIADHRVYGRVVVLAALHGSLATAAAVEVGMGPSVEISGLQLHAPLILEDGSATTLQVVLGSEDNEGGRDYAAFSRPDTDVSWLLHARGRMAPASGAHAPWPGAREHIAGLTPADADAVYSRVAGAGVDYGPSLRRVETFWLGEREAVAELRLPPDMREAGTVIHPAQLDGCFHAAAAAILDRYGQSVHLPFGWDRLRLAGKLPERVLCRARLAENTESGETLTADLAIHGLDGSFVGEVAGFTMKRATRQSLLAARVEELFHSIVWQEHRPVSGAETDIDRSPGKWLILADRNGVAVELAGALANRGQQVVAVGRFREPAPPGVELVEGDVDLRQTWRARLEDLPTDPSLRGVIHLAALDHEGPVGTDAGMELASRRVWSSALALVQGLKDAGAAPTEGLWFVTRGGQVIDGEVGSGLHGAPLWGLAPSVALEVERLVPRLIDLDPGGEADIPVEEFLAPDSETHIAWRGGKRHVARLLRSTFRATEDGGTPELHGTCLVTGGFGALGIQVAAWLADRGAETVILNGRREPGKAAREAIDAIMARGVEVRSEIADLTDQKAVEDLMDRIDAGPRPLTGIVHCAGMLADGLLDLQDEASFARVLGPKMLGAWRLHLATRDRALDLFVMFSSVVGTLGNYGQANYAAANAFLDQLARHRQAMGLAGQSVAWGPWSGSGMAEENRERVAGQIAQAGFGWLTAEQGLAALDRLLQKGSASELVAAVDWSAALAGRAVFPPMLEALLPRESIRSRRTSDLVEHLRQTPPQSREAALESFLEEQLQAMLHLPEPPSPTAGFFDLGIDSLQAIEFRGRLNRTLAGALDVPNTVMFDFPDIRSLARYLVRALDLAETEVAVPAPVSLRSRDDRIAIVGVACRFPGGEHLAGFRQVLKRGIQPIGPVPERVGESGGPVLDGRQGAFLARIDQFDAEFFRIAPVEAALLDPQQRLLLEASWHALEDAAIDPARLRGSLTGVFAGITTNDYRELVALSPGANSLYMTTGTSDSTAVGRIAFALGLEGPAMAVDTACSSSLVAVHQAATALHRGEADLALAGGANIILSAAVMEAFAEGGMLAPDGRCKTFDAAADGYVRGEGCGMLVLKRLAEAEADGDRIRGVILGSAINQDGASAGLTVPNGPAQERVIATALDRAGLDPGEVDYLEAHGTGTELGDPIEVRAAAAIYGPDRPPDRPLLIGSVKTNIGHLEAAAGIAGLIKVLVAMEDGMIPRHLNCGTPTPRLDWDRLPVQITTKPTNWPSEGERPPRAGVSSFGFSGTNVHLILEGYPQEGDGPGRGSSVPIGLSEGVVAAMDRRRHRVLPLSGRTEQAVRDMAADYRSWLAGQNASGNLPDDDLLADMVWTAVTGRQHFSFRTSVTFGSAMELDSRLADLEASLRVTQEVTRPRVVFLFTGQGSQWSGMGQELYSCEPVVRNVLDRCEEVFQKERGESLLGAMFGQGPADLTSTRWAQPALYALECAVAAFWTSLGVRPAAVLGHSVGELAAAQVAGVWSLADGLRFAAGRGALMGRLPRGGAMAAVMASEDRLKAAMAELPNLSIAADNGAQLVVSGPATEITALKESGLPMQRLDTSHGFHSVLMDPVLDELVELANELPAASPEVSLVSNVTGQVLEGAPDGAYWRRQARERVAYAAGVETLAVSGADLVIEIGPRPVLTALTSSIWPGKGDHDPVFLASLGHPEASEDSMAGLMAAVGRAWEVGAVESLTALFGGEARRRIAIPAYPFQHRRHWVDVTRQACDPGGHALLGRRTDLASGGVVFERSMSGEEPAWLAEHRVYGQPVAPGALWGSLALAAARATNVATPRLEAFQIHAPLLLPEGDNERRIQIVLGPPGPAAERSIHMHSRGPEMGHWTLLAEGRLVPATAFDETDGEKDLLPSDTTERVDIDEHYTALAALGIEYGPFFRRLDRLQKGTGQAIVELSLAAGQSNVETGIHPALLDGIFQAVATAGDMNDVLYLPFGWERLQIVTVLPERLTCHVRLRTTGTAAGGDDRGIIVADMHLADERGSTVGVVSGFSARRATRAQMFAAVDDIEGLLCTPVWRPCPPATAAEPEAPVEPPGVWVIASREPELGEGLYSALTSRGQSAILAGPDDGLSAIERPDHRRMCLKPGEREAWHKLFAGLAEETPFRGVVQLASAGRSCSKDAGLAATENLADALALVQGLEDAGVTPSAGTWFVGCSTCAGQAGSVLSGFARTVMLEAPHLNARWVEIDSETTEVCDRLIGELLRPDREPAVTWRGEERLALRLTRLPRRRLPAGDGWQLEADRWGVLENLHFATRPQLSPGKGEVRVGVEAAGLNFHDVLVATGSVDVGSPLGGELCGRVLETGADAGELAPGDRVVGFAAPAFASEAVTRAELLAPAPANLPAAALATMPTVFVTVALAFERAGLMAGQKVLVHAAAGGVGHAAIQLARGLGAEVIATASANKRDHVRAQGVDHVFDSRSTRFGADILAATRGAGVDMVLNSLTGAGFIEASLSCLAPGGSFVEIAKRGIWSQEEMEAARRDLRYHVLAVDEMLRLQPEKVGAVFRDIMGRLAAGAIAPLPCRSWPMVEADSAMSFMRRGGHVGKLVLTTPVGGRIAGTWLITGGLGALGLEIADWLAGEGAERIVLNGRRPPDADRLDAIAGIVARGAQVDVELGDIAEPAAVDALLGRIAESPPPLKGILHLAGSLADGTLTTLDRGDVEQVMSAKVRGAWNLHRATAGLDIDAFVLFSSVAGVMGSAGQANYAAANAFLDRLAVHRRSMGLPGLAIAWGAWSARGMAARRRERMAAKLEATGSGWLTPRQGRSTLHRLLQEGPAHCVAAPVDWQRVAAIRPDDPLLETIVPQAGAGEGEGVALAARLGEAPAEDRAELLESFLCQELQSVLQLPDLPSAKIGFFDLGMDSLMAIELRNRLNRAFAGIFTASTTIAFDHPDAASLAAHILQELDLWEEPADEPEEMRSLDRVRRHVEALSDDDLLAEVEAVLGDDDG